jgi:TRAP transporter 4TM/12TM fusion protein
MAVSSRLPEQAGPLYRHWVARLITAIAVTMSLFHLYIAYFGPPNAFTLRATHFAFALVIAFLLLPARRGGERKAPGVLDWAFVVVSLMAAGYPIYELQYFNTRMAYVGPVSTTDQVFAVMMILVVLEATRRAIGPLLPLTAIGFLAYQLFFTDIPLLRLLTFPENSAELLALAGRRIMRLLEYQYMTTDALFGIPAQVSATYVVLFVIFGALAERMGIGKLFMDFALALTGSAAGGPAKVAVVTSGLFGSVSGSAVANVMTTGTFTIPLMKRIGYPPHFSGAVEAVASTGGQIMPPIMGAAAFVMAEFLGVSYLTVATFAILPALLYYLAVFLVVHFEARKQGLVGLPRADLPRVQEVLMERGHLFIPLFVIIGTLVYGFSAPYAALMGILSVVPVVLMRKTTRAEFSLAKLIEGLEFGAINSVVVALACASAGIVIGVIAQTGLGLTFTGVVRAAAQDMLLPALILTMFAGIILGMGMPTTAAYIVQVALLVPALVRLGVSVEAAHMFVLYFAILSAITPPVALAVYAACGIARSDVWATSWTAVKLGLTGYIIPFMFVFGPSLLLIGEWQVVVLTVITASAGVALLAAGLSGYLIGLANPVSRLLYVSAAFVLINPGLVTDTIGAALAGAGLALNWLWVWQPRRVAWRQAPVTEHIEAPEQAPIQAEDLLEVPARQIGRGDL